MKKAVILILTLCFLFCLAGCSALQPEEKVFTVDSYSLQLTADTTFQEKTGGSFDLQITNNQAYVSVMAFQYAELPQDMTPADVYELQNQEIFTKRTNVVTLEEPHTLSGSEITFGLYSAENDGTKNYYASYLIDFPEEETCAWVLVTATPSYFEKNREQLNTIVCSLEPLQAS